MKLLKAEAGVNDGKAGLLSAAGLFAKGGIFDKKSESFNIQELDPYLLFDSRESMLGTLENPTLDLDPATPSTLDVITATRSSVATRTLPDGTIALAEQDTVRVDYTQGAELTPTKFQNFEYTEFDQWTKGSNTTVEADVTDAPDGSMTGYRLHMNSSAGTFLRQSITVNSPTVFSVYVKASAESIAAGTNQLQMQVYNIYPTFTATEQWQRVSYVITGPLSNTTVGFNDGVVGHTDLYIWGPQLEEGTTASDFVENTTGSPKFITGATYGPRVPMILVEPSATNSFLYSQPTSALAFGNSATKTFNDAIAPNGEIEAFRITHNGASGSVNFRATSSITFGSDSMVLSVWAKAGSGGNNYFTWSFQNLGGAVVRAGFKLEGDGETQLITSGNGGHTLQIETYPDGWYRCIIIGNTQSSGTTTQFLYTVSGYNESSSIAGGSVLLWGFQVEAGSVATSYIPTSGSTVTRAADSLVISGSAFSDFFSGSAGTFFIQAQNRTPELNGAVLMAQNSNRMFFYKSNPNRLSTYDGGTFTHHDGLVANQLFNAAVTFNTSNRSSSLDGSALDTDTINTQWAGADMLKIGFGYSNNFNGHYRRILFWPYHSDSL